MNKVILMGRLTRDVDIRYSAGENALAIARYTLAVDRRYKRDGEQSADFINCVAFGRTAEFAEKYFRQGLRITISGRIQTGSYTNRDGQKVYTTEVVIEEQEFADGKRDEGVGSAGAGRPSGSSQSNSSGRGGDYQYGRDAQRGRQNMNGQQSFATDEDGFMNIPDGIDEELPFN